jgi:hypothetical protein
MTSQNRDTDLREVAPVERRLNAIQIALEARGLDAAAGAADRPKNQSRSGYRRMARGWSRRPGAILHFANGFLPMVAPRHSSWV